MDKRLFESSEFYNRRYQNFSTLIILPVFLLVCLLVCFCFFGKRELTIKVVGEVQPVSIISEVQSTTGNEIIEEHLEENRRVKEGDLLVRYKDNATTEQMNYLQKQLTDSKSQKENLERLRKGIEQEQNTFLKDDEYGYSQILKDYFSQKQALKENNQKENADINSQNEAVASTKAAIDNEIQKTQNQITSYSALAQAIRNDASNFNQESELYPLFDSYEQQIKAAGENKGIKKQILAEIQTNIEQLENTNSNYQAQKASAGSFVQQNPSLDDQLASLKSQQLSSIDKELATVKAKITELETNLTLQQDLDRKNTITASSTGIIHLIQEISGKKYISEGTSLAQIYPDIKAGDFVYLIAYVDSQTVNSIHKNDKVRFSSKKENIEFLDLTCKIREISASPEKTKQGNFFKVVAKAKVSRENQFLLRYGLQGNYTIITGKKTYFEYFRDKFFNKN